jgi:hypothetical protein
MHGDVAFAPVVPTRAPLVVWSKPGTRVWYVVLLVCAAVEVLLAVAVVVFVVVLGSWLLLAVVPLLAVQLALVVPVVREYQGLLGPQLAADHTGVWVRTGLGRRPEVVHLPWWAVDGVDATHKGPVVRILSRRGEALYPGRPHWRARSLRRRFGTPFVVDGKRSAEHPEQIAFRLRQTAG